MNNLEKLQHSIHGHVRATVIGLVLLVGGLGGWAATTEISGAVIAPGVLVVDSSVKKVQHPTGGVVGELRVRDGDRVEAGQVVLRLDETQTRANLGVLARALDELRARRTRLEGERDSAAELTFPVSLQSRRDDPEVKKLLSGELSLFAVRRTAREGQVAQLEQRIGQVDDQIRGSERQLSAKDKEVALIQQELSGVRELFQKGLIPIARVTVLERDAARLEGDAGALMSTIAQLRGKRTETELQILQVDRDMHTEVGKELAEVRGKISEYEEKAVAAEDQLRRVDLRAPQSGTVHQLAIHTVGGVVSPGEPVMLIVPAADELTVEARVEPQKIDRIRILQSVGLRFPNFNQRTTPEIAGIVQQIAADLTQDQKTGQSYYVINVKMPPEEVAKLGPNKLIPGMPVEAFAETAARTALSYLMKPLTDQARKALRED